MKRILGLVLSLTVISAICAAVLAYVDARTREPIASMRVRQENAAVRAVMPKGVAEVRAEEGFFVGLDAAGKVAGYAAKGSDPRGYGGEIVLMVGFEADAKTLVCYRTLAAAETPGLGMKLKTPEFSAQFAGRDGTALKVTKGKAKGNEIEAIASATITSKAVCRAIADAAKKIAAPASAAKPAADSALPPPPPVKIVPAKPSETSGRALDPKWREHLPRPVYDANPALVDFYYRAWEIAHTRVDELPGLPAPRYMDEAHMSNRIWIWDTCFMVHFCKYSPREFPGIESLENFYGVMLADKSVPLPKVKGNVWCGADCGKMLDFRIHHPDNPPLFAWTEYVYALQTGDRARLARVYAEKRWLQRWFELFDSFDPAAPQPYGSVVRVALKRRADGYNWGGCPSGMDNTPRGRKGAKDSGPVGGCPNDPDLLWIDALAQQGLSALYLSRIASLLGRADEAKAWRAKYDALREKANRLYWDEKDGLYYDIRDTDKSKVKVRSIASFWPILAEMASPAQVARMAPMLSDPKTFGGAMPAPSLARDDPDFHADGSYWRGSMWMPTGYMAVKALDTVGRYAQAREVASKILGMMHRTYVEFEPHTIWECYSPTEPKPATNKRNEYVRYDFCGWSALGPISLFVEDVIGVKEANAFTRTLLCDFARDVKGRAGVENYRFGDVTATIVATAKEIRVTSDKPFTLVADGKSRAVKPGENVFAR